MMRIRRDVLCFALCLLFACPLAGAGLAAQSMPGAGAGGGGGKGAAPDVAELPGDESLIAEAASLGVRYAGKQTSASKLERKLDPLVRRALNEWAGLAQRLQLSVVVPEKAEALVLGRAPLELLTEASRWADQTAALFEACRPADGSPARGAVVMLLFDGEGFASEAWPGLLEALLERNLITRAAVDGMRSDPGSLLLRSSLIFVQHTWDMVGDAAAGDDEYRLGNEVAHKTAQLLMEARFGLSPEVLRWGLGYVAEQRLFGSIYQFNVSGVVAEEDHFGWPAKVMDQLKGFGKQAPFAWAEAVLDTPSPGTAAAGQQLAWALLEHALVKDPARLAALLGELGSLQREADPHASRRDYAGDASRTLAACTQAWSQLKPTTLRDHLKRMK